MKSWVKLLLPVCIFMVMATVFAIAPMASVLFKDDSDPYIYEVEDTGVVYDSMYLDIEWKKDRSCHIVNQIQMTFLDNGYDGTGSHGIYVDIPVNSGESVRDLQVDMNGFYGTSVEIMPYTVEYESGFAIVRVRVGDPDRTFRAGGKIQGIITYDYITPVHPDGNNILDINAIGYGWMSKIEEAHVAISYPEAPIGKITATTSGYGGVSSKQLEVAEYEASVRENAYTVHMTDLAAFHGIRIKCEMPDGVLENRSFGSEMWLTIVSGVVLLAAVAIMMVLFGRDKPLTPVVDFYPPRIDCDDGQKRHMLPVQMGKLIDGSCSLNDVTSLIFYWASEGYILIEETDDDDTKFIKLKELDEVTDYEKRMFDKLFAYGKKLKDGTVCVRLSKLKGKFGSAVTAAKTSADMEYNDKLYVKRNTVLFIVMAVLCAVYGLGIALTCTFRVSVGFVNMLGLAVLIPVALSAAFGNMLVRYYAKFSAKKRNLLLGLLFLGTALCAVGVMFLIPTNAMSWIEKALFAVLLAVPSALTPFLTRRTEFYTEQLNSILGFRDFLRDAEKDKLEMLLKDDPQYYYNILPYANVLGVSDIWAKKFDDLTIEPPAYYNGRGVSVFDVIIINRLCRSVGNSLTYVPPSSPSRGSFSGGSHGGGGGGSFGGFGGGGGGRW